MVKVGDQAPDFELPDQFGHPVKLSDVRENGNLVIFFYPKDNTTGCTMESCSFRDNYAGFKELNTKIIGISRDSSDSHKAFADKHRLPFPLLSDAFGVARKLFGVKRTFGILPGRATFVIDQHGTIRHAISSQFHIQKHIDETIEIVKKLHAQEPKSRT